VAVAEKIIAIGCRRPARGKRKRGVAGMELPVAASIRGLAARLGWKMPAAYRSSAV